MNTTPDAITTDPVTLGWMRGAPPPADKLVRHADMTHMAFPRTRWAFAHQRQLMPTTRVWRGAAGPGTLPQALRQDLDAVRFTPMGASQAMTWSESLQANFTDAIVVLHQGRVVYERYFGVMAPHAVHIAMSVTKSYTGTLAAMLVHEGALDELAPVTRYVPELAHSAFAHATVRQVMDMVTNLRYSEDYTDPNADIQHFIRAIGLLPRAADYSGPVTTCQFLQTVAAAGPHGQAFTYKTVNTDVLGWMLRRVTGQSLGELLSERIWQKIGAQEDASLIVDSEGTEFAGGGLSATVRDMARFGETMRLGGHFNGQQIVPTAVVEDIQRGADPTHFVSAGFHTLPGASYRSMWWVTHNADGAYMARGVHGQGIYINPKAEVVIARFASHPMAGNVHLDPTTLPAYQSLCDHLRH